MIKEDLTPISFCTGEGSEQRPYASADGTAGLQAALAELTHGGAVRLPAILVTLYLLLWCGVHALTSYFYLREKNEE